MVKNIPSLKVLTAFEAVVENGNLSKAAESLGITHSAVSQSIKGLENLCGSSLFHRSTRSVRLTDIGEVYYREITEALNQIRNATKQVISGENSISVNMPTSFAIRLLNPKLEDFLSEYKTIDLKIIMIRRQIHLSDFISQNIDISIEYGKKYDWTGCIVEKLANDKLVLTGAPELSENIDLSNIKTLFHKHKSLIISQNTRRDDYLHWCSKAGLAVPDSPQHVYYTTTVQAIKGAVRGEGLLVTHKILINEELKSGKLMQITQVEVDADESYYLVYPEKYKNSISVQLFIRWIKQLFEEYR